MRSLALATLVAAMTGCGTAEDAPEVGARVDLTIAALHLEAVGDVVWDIEVVNGRASPGPDVVVRRRVAASTHGDGVGSASFVGPCDAGADASTNRVRLWVVGVYAAPVTTLGDFAAGDASAVVGNAVAFQNPTTTATPLSQTFECLPDRDVPVTFDVSLLRPAEQGFFDVAVSFNDIFCSAKFDCCTPDGETGECATYSQLLFDATGARSDTMVLALACTGGVGDGVDTELFLDALELDCSPPNDFESGFAPDFTIDPSGAPGNACTTGVDGMGSCTGVVVEHGALDADDYLFQVARYRGAEALTFNGQPGNTMYWNVALGVKHAVGGAPGIEDCMVRTRGSAQPIGGTTIVGGNIDGNRVYPFIAWQVDVDECRQEPMSSEMVASLYSGLGDPVPFGHRYAEGAAAPLCPLACQNGGVCSSLRCACPMGFDGPGCAGTVDHCAGVTVCTPGSCVSTLDGFHCSCPAGYDGTNTSACTPSPTPSDPGHGPGYVSPGDFPAPSLLPSSAAGSGAVTVSWGASAARYEVYRDGGLVTSTTGTSFLDTGLANGPHVYSYRAYNGSNVLIGQSASAHTTTTNGFALRTTFGTNGIGTLAQNNLTVTAIGVDAQGRAVVIGSATAGRAFIARFTTAGVPDPTFNGTGIHFELASAIDGAIARYDSLVFMPGDRIVVGGEWSTRFNGYWQRKTVLHRYDADGSRDAGFGGVFDYNAYTCPGSTCGGGGPAAFDPGVNESLTALAYDATNQVFYGFATLDTTGALIKYSAAGQALGGFRNGTMADPTLPTKRKTYYIQGVTVPGGGGHDGARGLGVVVRDDGDITFVAHASGASSSRPTWLLTVDTSGAYVTQGMLTNDSTVTSGAVFSLKPDGTTYFCASDKRMVRAVDGILDAAFVNDPVVTDDFGCTGGLYGDRIRGVAGHVAFGLAPNGYASFQHVLPEQPQFNQRFAAVAPDGDLYVVDRFNTAPLRLRRFVVP